MTKIINNNTLQNIAILSIVAIFFISDRFLKALAISREFAENVPIFGSWLQFNFVKNYYIAFSLPLSGWFLNIIIIVLIISLLIFLIYSTISKKNYKLLFLPILLIIFGSISNLIDRLIFGYVVDYIDCLYFTIFNMADVMITGGIIIILYHLKKIKI